MTSSKTVQNMKQHIRQMQSGDVRDENESNLAKVKETKF